MGFSKTMCHFVGIWCPKMFGRLTIEDGEDRAPGTQVTRWGGDQVGRWAGVLSIQVSCALPVGNVLTRPADSMTSATRGFPPNIRKIH